MHVKLINALSQRLKLASGRRREDAEETGMDSKRRRESTSGSGAWRGFACGAKIEEPKKPGKSGKNRAAKAVLARLAHAAARHRAREPERRTRGEPVAELEGEEVVVTAKADPVTGSGNGLF